MADPNFSTVRVLLHGDEGSNGSTVYTAQNESTDVSMTASGTGVTYTTVAPVFGIGQFEFSDAAAYIIGSAPSPIIALDSPWTLEANVESTPATGGDVLWVGNNSYNMCGVGLDNVDGLTLWSTYDTSTSTVAWTNGTPIHLAITRDTVGGSLKLYVNGTLGATIPHLALEDVGASSYQIGIGQCSTWDGASVIGQIDEVRFSAMARYTGNFTAPSAAFESGPPPAADRELTGENAIDAISSTGTISSSVPTTVELSGSSALSDLSGSGTIGVLPAVSMVVPAATLEGTIGQRYLMATVPSAELTASMVAYEGLSLDAQVPVASMSAWAGLRMDGVVPAATVQASGAVPNTLRIDAEIPRVTSTGVVLLGRSLSLNGALPAASMSGHTGLQLIGVVPSATVDGHIVTGGAYRLNATVPMATMQAAASSVNMLRLNGTVPVVTRANWLSIDKPVPAAGVFARASQVVATTRVAYSFTLSNSAMTRYPAYPFIQVIRMGDAYYGIAEDGLYEVGGETDNGVGIPWAWETCMTDFGQPERKTVVSAYLGGYVPQSMSYTIKSGDEPTGTNAHATTATTVLRNHRQKFGLGRKSRFFAFGLSATQGRVAIESVEFEVATMSRRI